MSNMKIKSEDNFKAANLLQENNFYNTSIHAFYYSCIQKLIYILRTSFHLTELEITEEFSNSKNGHNYYINKVFNDCKNNRLSRKKCNYFKNNIYKLRKSRTKADYKEELATKEKSIKAEERTKNILDLLEEAYYE